ncbi:MAG: DMT family transporter [Firmicutes bacterium]|nr:DMT family transporter [Candidatus Caballimonas caccae]
MLGFDKKAFKGGIFLFFAALFWGSAFVAQKICEDYPFATNCLRFFFSLPLLFLISVFYDKINLKNGVDKEQLKESKKKAIKGGAVAGITLAVATTCQQLGLHFGTTAGKSGFLTAVYMVLIPIFGLLLHKKAGANVWLSVVLAFLGVSLMSIKEGFSINIGDVITLACAVFFAINVLVVDHFIEGADCIIFSLFQMLSSGVICLIPFIIVNLTGYEVLTIEAFKFIILPILYIAVFSCGIAYTCQVIGQAFTPPAPAAVIMSLESVFALVFSLTLGGFFGRLFNVDLSEQMTVQIGFGIALVFISVMLSQFNVFEIIKAKTGKKNKE